VQLWIFYGPAGAGKSFVGRVCADEWGFEVYDGDRDLTPDMQRALREKQMFSDDMRVEFTRVLSRGIRERWESGAKSSAAGLAVCSALFKRRDRKQLQIDFPNARLTWVRAPEPLIEARLQKRTGHLASASYASLVNPGFEPPEPGSDVLDNDGDRERIVEQLRAHLAS
jgi:gluconate kinase